MIPNLEANLYSKYSPLLYNTLGQSGELIVDLDTKYFILGSYWSSNRYASKYHLNQLKIAERISNTNNGDDIKKIDQIEEGRVDNMWK